MTDPMATIQAVAAKAIVQAGVNGLAELLKVPAVFKRQGEAEELRIAHEVGYTVHLLQAVTGTELARQQAWQEAAWEARLQGLLAEHPDAAQELKALAAEIDAALPNAQSAGGVARVVNAGRDSYVAGRDITINHHNPDHGESQLELSDITLTATSPPRGSGAGWGQTLCGSAVLDLKLRNLGGQPAILHSATLHIHEAVSLSPYSMVGFLPYDTLWARGLLNVSATYDIALPVPERAAAIHHSLNLSQAIEPAGFDRFHIRLGTPETMDTLIYLLHFDIYYDARRETLTSPTMAIAHPPGSRLVRPDEILSDLLRFRQAVREKRDAIDREMTTRGLPSPDWDNHPPGSRAELPADLGNVNVNDAFWNPDDSLAQRLQDIRAYYARVVSIITGADVRHESLPAILTQAQTALAQLPAIAAEFGVQLR